MEKSEERSVDDVIRRIRAYAASQGWKKSRLAVEAGMVDTTLRDFDKADWNPTLETVRRLEAIIPNDFTPPQPTPGEPDTERAA